MMMMTAKMTAAKKYENAMDKMSNPKLIKSSVKAVISICWQNEDMAMISSLSSALRYSIKTLRGWYINAVSIMAKKAVFSFQRLISISSGKKKYKIAVTNAVIGRIFIEVCRVFLKT